MWEVTDIRNDNLSTNNYMNNLANNAKTESHQIIWLNSIFLIVLNGMKHQFFYLFVAKEDLFMYVNSLVQMVKARPL